MSMFEVWYQPTAVKGATVCTWCEEPAAELFDVRSGEASGWNPEAGELEEACVCEPCADAIIETRYDRVGEEDRMSREHAQYMRECEDRERRLSSRR